DFELGNTALLQRGEPYVNLRIAHASTPTGRAPDGRKDRVDMLQLAQVIFNFRRNPVHEGQRGSLRKPEGDVKFALIVVRDKFLAHVGVDGNHRTDYQRGQPHHAPAVR